jgi:ATP-dependent DNA helicase DinG
MIDDILGPGGAVARRLGDRFEPRPQQLEMARAVEQAMEGRRNLLVEAGTGVGKSLAYLVPAVEQATRHKKRIVISTHTINLQEQLIDKDIPLIASVYPDEFTAVLVKGRNNYLCLRRMNNAMSHRQLMFDDNRQFESLQGIADWASKTTDGSLATLPLLPEPGVWDEVKAEHGNCLGKRCPHYEPCFWQAAKRRMNAGNILVVNHALFFSDLALRAAGVNYLPKYDVVIFDEAHTIEEVASQHFAVKLSEASLRYQLRQLFDERKGKGLLALYGGAGNDAMAAVMEAQESAELFFDRCAMWQEQHGRPNGRIHDKHIVETDLAEKLQDVGKHLRAMLLKIESPEAQLEISSKADRVMQMSQMIDVLLSQTMDDAVYWMDLQKRTHRGGGATQRVTLSAAPVDVSAGLRLHLFGAKKSVIMTSATLCTADAKAAVVAGRATRASSPSSSSAGAGNPFAYIARRLGVDDAMMLQLGSPFDYAAQATVYLETNLPDPSDLTRFMPAACAKIEHYVRHTHGGAFVLFTSFAMLRDAADRLRPAFEHLGLPVLVQGKDAGPRQLLARFRETEDAVLFGTSSFWQGIDVQGEKLRNVIIVKLPFSVPDEPIIEAKLEAVTRTGGNPFMDLSLPEAIIRFKQGFGRLIRSKSDKGIVAILDSRVKTKRYGRMFLDALPPARMIEVSD